MTKKNKKTIIKKVETVEEFLARGGKVTIVPPQEIPESKQPVRSTVNGLPTLMSLPDGEHFFGETRKKAKKKMTNEEFTEKVNNSSLPPEIMASIMEKIGSKK